MTINQALKEKNRLAGKLKVLDQRIQNNVKWVKGNKPSYLYSDLFKERGDVAQKLIDLKYAISKATIPIIGKIILLAETKAELSLYRTLDVRDGIIHDRYSSTTPLEYESAINQRELDLLIEGAEIRISKIQDDLDQFNASTEI